MRIFFNHPTKNLNDERGEHTLGGPNKPPGYGEKKEYGSEDLYPKHKDVYDNYAIVKENNKTIWRIRFDDNSTLDFTKLDSPK